MTEQQWTKVLAQATIDSNGANPTTDKAFWDAVMALCQPVDEADLDSKKSARDDAAKAAEIALLRARLDELDPPRPPRGQIVGTP